MATTKTTATKTATKGAAKTTKTTKGAAQAQDQAQETKGAAIFAACVQGVADRIAKGSKFYARALSYHRKAGTVFPRAKVEAARVALTMEDVTEVFRQHDAHILAPGSMRGQAVFDAYMMGATK